MLQQIIADINDQIQLLQNEGLQLKDEKFSSNITEILQDMTYDQLELTLSFFQTIKSKIIANVINRINSEEINLIDTDFVIISELFGKVVLNKEEVVSELKNQSIAILLCLYKNMHSEESLELKFSGEEKIKDISITLFL